MGKRKRQREKEDREERERVWKKLEDLENIVRNMSKSTAQAGQPSLPLEKPPAGEPANAAIGDAFTQTSGEPIFTSAKTSATKEMLPTVTTLPALSVTDSNSNNEQTNAESTEPCLDEETIKILRVDPNKENINEANIHPALAARWTKWLTEGIKKEDKVELLSSYPRAKNCLLEGQLLNLGVARMMTPAAIKRDKFAQESQNMTGSAMLSLGLAISLLLDEKEEEGINREKLLKYLVDSGKLLCEIHHHEAVTRKAFIIPGVEKNMKVVLDESKMDKYLFGAELSEKIKSEKSIEKIAFDLKPKPPAKPASFRQPNLNWKPPPLNNQDLSKVGNTIKRVLWSSHKGNRVNSNQKGGWDQKNPAPQGSQSQPKNNRLRKDQQMK